MTHFLHEWIVLEVLFSIGAYKDAQHIVCVRFFNISFDVIAASLIYIDGSAFGPGMQIEFSVDDGMSFAAADQLTVEENGEERRATADDYTHIRWVMDNDLEAGAQAMARFAAVLE